MKRLMHLTAGLSLLVLSACAAVQPAVETVASGTFLYVEYERMVEIVSELDFSEEERDILNQVHAEINKIRLEVGAIYKGDGVEVLVSALSASDYMNRLSSAYLRGRSVVKDFFERRNMTVPGQLRIYDHAAMSVWMQLTKLIDEGNKHIDLREVVVYLRAAISMYATVKTGVQI